MIDGREGDFSFCEQGDDGILSVGDNEETRGSLALVRKSIVISKFSFVTLSVIIKFLRCLNKYDLV